MHERVGRRDEASRDQYRPRPYLVNVEPGSDLIERPEPDPNPIEVCGQRAKKVLPHTPRVWRANTVAKVRR